VDRSWRLLVKLVWWGKAAALPIGFLLGNWAVIEAVADKATFREAMLWGFGVLGAVTWGLLGLLYLLDRFIAYTTAFYEGKDVADLLESWAESGRDTIKLTEITAIWAGEESSNAVVAFVRRNVRLRTLKGAVRQGLLPQVNAGEQVSQNTRCRTVDVVTFFRNRTWLKAKPEK
jgi:hypothetical protein